jgi:hypothetical protein
VPIRATPALAPGASVCGKERGAGRREQQGGNLGELERPDARFHQYITKIACNTTAKGKPFMGFWHFMLEKRILPKERGLDKIGYPCIPYTNIWKLLAGHFPYLIL